MNEDILRYKTRFISLVLLLGYAYMHMRLAGVYTEAGLDQLINFSVRLPYGQRLLVPALAHFLQTILPLQADELFFLLEWLFISLFFLVLRALLATHFSPKQAQCLSWLFILLLPLMSIVNYRFTAGGETTFFYPCDSASLFFMAAGFLCCLQARWRLYIPLVFLATFNRESSILLVLLIPALHWDKGRQLIKPLLWAALAFILARFIVLALVQGLPGTLVEWYFRASEYTLFEINLFWLLNDQNALFFIFCFAGLPLFWFTFYDYIPFQFRRLRYVALIYFLGLLLVGNFTEVRIFNEILVLLYLPVCIAMSRWQAGEKPYLKSVNSWFDYVDRYLVLTLCAVIILFRCPLNSLVIWLSHRL